MAKRKKIKNGYDYKGEIKGEVKLCKHITIKNSEEKDQSYSSYEYGESVNIFCNICRRTKPVTVCI